MSHSLARLNLIQEAITLGDEDVIVLQSVRLPAEMKSLAELLTAKKYADAAVWIGEYRRDNFAPVEYRDPEIAGLQMELANLESVLAELLAEKNEALRKVDTFTAEHNANLGEILGTIFKLLMQMQEKRAATEQSPEQEEELRQAREEYEEFEQQQADTPQTVSLDAEQKKEIKKLFRKAAHICHPDRLPDEKKEEGIRMFQELEAAYRKQDISRVREILRKLEGGDWTALSAEVFDADLLRQHIEIIRNRISAVKTEVEQIYNDEIWQLIESIKVAGETWDDYFAATKRGLDVQLAELEANHEK